MLTLGKFGSKRIKMNTKNTPSKSILLTFDVEDWFQVENFKGYIPFDSWDAFELRVEKNTHTILNLLDTFPSVPKATFFVLGWIAQKMPHLIRELVNRGHEVASHGQNHHLCTTRTTKALLEELVDSKKLLEDMTGAPIKGYRAPSFAINDDILKLIRDAGYLYDSSYNSFALHGRYGTITLPQHHKRGAAYHLFDNFYEIPVSNLTLKGKVFPLGGGGYFRLIPFPIFKQGISSFLKHDDAFIFYSHPWEFDSQQPRVEAASPGFKFRHYINLHRTEKKLTALVDAFSGLDFVTCNQYLTIQTLQTVVLNDNPRI